ncbi:hypothetical protein ACFY36_50545 [Actinoplanes sp. NPDC000266]
MLTALTLWPAVRLTTLAQQMRAPDPAPAPTSTGFDWDRVHPDGSAIPKSDIFYTIMRAVMFLGGVAAVCGLIAGAIAFSIGPIFGAHIVSDRGKSMMWRAGFTAVIVGSGTAIVAGLLVL